MKRIRSIISTLIQINVVIVVLSILCVAVIRKQQAMMTDDRQKLFSQNETEQQQIQEKISQYQKQVQTNEQKLSQYEQDLKNTQVQLEAYKQQNRLLRQKDVAQKPSTSNLNQGVYKSNNQSNSKPVNQPQVSSPKSTPFKQANISSPKPTPVKTVPSVARVTQVIPKKSETLIIPIIQPSPSVQLSQKPPLEITTNNRVKTNPNPQPSKRLNQDQEIVSMTTKAEPDKVSPTPSDETILTKFKTKRDLSIYYANNLAYGLIVAHNKGEIKHGTKMYKKVQTAIRALRKGESKEVAMNKAKVPENVMNQLIKWGEQRPGSLIISEIDSPKDQQQPNNQ